MKKIVTLQWLLVACVALILVLYGALKGKERELQETRQELIRSDQAQGRMAAALSGSVKTHFGPSRGANRFRTSVEDAASNATH